MKPKPKLRLTLIPKRRGDPRASAAAFVLQVVILLVIVPSLLVPVAFDMLRDDTGRAVMPERITFVTAVPRNGEPTREAPRAGGDGREATPNPEPAAPIATPTDIPTGVTPSTAPAREAPGGVGPLVGGGGPTQGIRPSFNDPRLWQTPTDVIEAPIVPLTRADSLQLLLHATAASYVDSMRRATPEGIRAPGDWTFRTKNGKRYGVDPQFIRLGDFSIPTAVLALLPMNNNQGNPVAMERVRRINSMRSEIIEQAERRARDDDFYAAVRALRERKERERQEAAKRTPTTQPPAVSR